MICQLITRENEAFESFMSHFRKIKESAQEIICSCPVCGKDKLYISIGECADGHQMLLHCKHDCDYKDILAAVGLQGRDLYLNRTQKRLLKEQCSTQRQHVYTSESGLPLYRKTIYKFHTYWEYNKKQKFPGDKDVFWEHFNAVSNQYESGGSCNILYHLDKLKGDTVYIPEGEKDCESLESMGFVATSSGGGAKHDASEWIKNNYAAQLQGITKAYILADNDEIGIEYAQAVAEYLTQSGKECKLIKATDIYPESQHKWDISDIIGAVGADRTKELLNAAADVAEIFKAAERRQEQPIKTEYINTDCPPYVICKNGHYSVHAQLLADYIAEKEHFYFVQARDRDSQRLFWYENGVYNRISARTAKSIIKNIIAEYKRELITAKVIEDCYKLLSLADDSHYLPSDEMLDTDENVINFSNGILHLDTLKLTAHTPELKSTIQIPCKWNPKASPKIEVFKQFLEHLSRGETAAQQTLLEAIGFCISNVSVEKFKSSLFLIGAGHSGKTQYIKLITRLIGSENFCAMPFQKLEARFQIANLYRKRLAADDDCRYLGGGEVSTFKSMTGGGELQAEEKGLQGFPFTYKGFYMIAANDLPLFTGDRGKHVYDRIIPIQCGDSIPIEEQDKELIEKLYAEREGIVVASVMALKEAIARNYAFTIGENSQALRQRYQIENDSTLKFIDECCTDITDRKKAIPAPEMWRAFQEWCRNSGEYIPKQKDFKKAIAEKYGIPIYSVIKATSGKRYYPFTLSDEYKEELHCYDSIMAINS